MTTAVAAREVAWAIETRYRYGPPEWHRGDVVYLAKRDAESMVERVRDYLDVAEVRLVEVRLVRAL